MPQSWTEAAPAIEEADLGQYRGAISDKAPQGLFSRTNLVCASLVDFMAADVEGSDRIALDDEDGPKVAVYHNGIDGLPDPRRQLVNLMRTEPRIEGVLSEDLKGLLRPKPLERF